MDASSSSSSHNAVSYMNIEEAARHALSVHWRAIIAGLFISMLVYFILIAMGVGIGSGQAIDVIRGEDAASTLGKGVGVWMALTVLISLAVGSYATSRVSGVVATRIGYIQGAVVAALFFIVMISQVGVALGAVGRGVSAIAGTVGSGAASAVSRASESPQINMIVEDAIGDLNLKSSPETVATGFLSRLIRGNDEAATNYLAAQTGISRTEATTRYNALKAQVEVKSKEIGEQSAKAAQTAGWVTFALLSLGTLSAMLGGAFGAQLNIRQPVDAADRKAMRTTRPSYT